MSETLAQRSLLFESGSVFPGNVPLLGHLPTFLSALWRAKGNVSGAFESLFRQAQQKTFRYKLGPQWMVLTVDPQLMHHVLYTEFARYPKSPYERHVLDPVMEGGMITAEGEEWKAHRQIFQPFFSTDFVKTLVPLVHETVSERISAWDDIIDVDYEMCAITFDLMARFFLGGKVGQYEGDQDLDFYTAHLTVLEGILESRVFPLCRFQQDIMNSLNINTKLKISSQIIKDFILNRVDKAVCDQQSILSIIIKEFSSKDIFVKEMLSMFAAGLTTAHLLTWTSSLVAKDSYRQDCLRDEIQQFHHERTDEQDMSLQDLEQLHYLDAVIHEGLRLYPPAPYLLRTYGERPLDPLIVMSIWSMHRDPDLWSQHDAFVPERWLRALPGHETAGEMDGQRKLFPGFLPFGDGPRICIGRRFALVEAKLIFMEIVNRFTLTLVDPILPVAKTTILTRPQRPIHLRVLPVVGRAALMSRSVA
jgi:cytochrome P450